MASWPPRVDTIPHHVGIGRMRRFAAAFLERGHSDAGFGAHLRGALPLRYPGDAAGLDHDPLTGLASQLVFVGALESWAGRSGRDRAAFSLVLIDVDHLGYINASQGHVQGDRLLQEIALAMRQRASRQDRLFRIGGDEFAMLMAETGSDDAHRRAQAILEALEFPTSDALVSSFSAGISGMPWSAGDPGVLFRQAAAVVADVKHRGGAAVGVFDPRRHAVPVSTSPSSADLVERVVRERLLRPVFQPIVDLRTGNVLGFEGLVRVHGRTPGPDTSELFAAAAASNRVEELDLACIDAVVAGARAIRPDRLLTLNVSPRTLSEGNFDPAWLHQSLVRAGISPGRVIVEVSDDKRVEDLSRLHSSFLELQRLGLRLAADDVSTDDPARRLLQHMPFDIVKIDLTRMWEGAHTGPQLAFLRDTAHSRQARVVAEGVETSEQLAAVRDLEFAAGQGYLLGRPEPGADEPVLDLERLETADGRSAEERPQGPVASGDGSTAEVPPERLAVFPPPAKPMIEAEVGGA